jgi:hypothetical protein
MLEFILDVWPIFGGRFSWTVLPPPRGKAFDICSTVWRTKMRCCQQCAYASRGFCGLLSFVLSTYIRAVGQGAGV